MKDTKCVVFVFVKKGKFLVEKRPETEEIDSGKVTIPGGHVENNESLEDALVRECKEEIGVEPVGYRKFYEGEYTTGNENMACYYYAITKWKGKIRAMEVATLSWLRFSEADKLDVLIDREAIMALKNHANK